MRIKDLAFKPSNLKFCLADLTLCVLKATDKP